MGKSRREKYLDGKPPEGVSETRTFGAVLCFRATNCGYCRWAPHEACKHYHAMREIVQAEGVVQCPEYKPAARS